MRFFWNKPLPYLAKAEYWVYLPGEKMPPQAQLMDRVLAANPYKQRGRAPIGPPEGLLFSDIRTHIALVLRSKNPQMFRPDLYASDLEITQAHLEALAGSKSLVRLSYISEQPIPDARHLQFLPHLSDAIAELGEGTLILDETQQVLFTRARMAEWLGESIRVDGPENHVRVRWNSVADEAGATAESIGLAKIGLDEVRTLPMTHDLEALGVAILQEALIHLWKAMKIPPTLSVKAFDDEFRLTFTPMPKQRVQSVRIERTSTHE